jgi:hypothetical protein
MDDFQDSCATVRYRWINRCLLAVAQPSSSELTQPSGATNCPRAARRPREYRGEGLAVAAVGLGREQAGGGPCPDPGGSVAYPSQFLRGAAVCRRRDPPRRPSVPPSHSVPVRCSVGASYPGSCRWVPTRSRSAGKRRPRRGRRRAPPRGARPRPSARRSSPGRGQRRPAARRCG